jgi:two-component system sensor histidine kinase VicK
VVLLRDACKKLPLLSPLSLLATYPRGTWLTRMPETPSPHYTPLALEIENQALQAELQRLRQDRITADDHQALLDRYEQTQVRFRTVFEHSPLGQKIIDADLTICQANPALVAMLGFTHTSDVVGRKIMDFAHPAHRADWIRLQESLWAHETPYFVLETRLVRQSGSAFWCQITSVLFLDEAGEMGYTTLIDVDEQKRREREN